MSQSNEEGCFRFVFYGLFAVFAGLMAFVATGRDPKELTEGVAEIAKPAGGICLVSLAVFLPIFLLIKVTSRWNGRPPNYPPPG